MQHVWTFSLLVVGAAGWAPHPVCSRLNRPFCSHAQSAVFALVTADDVEAAVETAEKLWADALAAREQADQLSSEAEAVAEDADGKSAEEANRLKDMEKSGKFSLATLSGAQIAVNSGSATMDLIADAVNAAEEAERLEALAEEALAAVEVALAQHESDFPNSP
jgi:ABC-type hemin transport system substrate-binding protein